MKIRVYGVQPDELPVYEKAKAQYGFTFDFASAPLSEATVDEVHDCEGLVLLTNCKVNEAVAKTLSERGRQVPGHPLRRQRPH